MPAAHYYNSDFRNWLDNADLPMQADDGHWYDLETGVRYGTPSRHSRTGLPKLTGSLAQREWAEHIRDTFQRKFGEQIANALKSLTEAKAWIDNRSADAKQLEAVAAEAKDAKSMDRALAKENGWPALTGTPSQRKWAIEIRKQLTSSGDQNYQRLAKLITKAPVWIDLKTGNCSAKAMLDMYDSLQKYVR